MCSTDDASDGITQDGITIGIKILQKSNTMGGTKMVLNWY